MLKYKRFFNIESINFSILIVNLVATLKQH